GVGRRRGDRRRVAAGEDGVERHVRVLPDGGGDPPAEVPVAGDPDPQLCHVRVSSRYCWPGHGTRPGPGRGRTAHEVVRAGRRTLRARRRRRSARTTTATFGRNASQHVAVYATAKSASKSPP